MNANEVVISVFGNTDDSAKAVDHVFAVLEATYGASWARSMGTAPIGTIKTVWAFQLGNFTHSAAAKQCILWALQNLPDTVPSVMQFRNLCRSAPSVSVALELPRPAPSPAIVAAVVNGMKAKPMMQNGMKDWAYRLKARHSAGETLNLNQIQSYQLALVAA